MSDNKPKSGNFQDLEEIWAKKAFGHAQIYEDILLRKDPIDNLVYTLVDNELYKDFRAAFPDLNIENFDYEASKTTEGKAKWHELLIKYNEEKVREFDIACLLRPNALEPLGQDNSCIVPRVQFLMIEIARTREGINQKFRNLHMEK